MREKRVFLSALFLPGGFAMAEPKLVSIDRAATLAGMNERTFRRRVAAGEVVTLTDPRDRRRKLVRLDDLRNYLGEVDLQKAS